MIRPALIVVLSLLFTSASAAEPAGTVAGAAPPAAPDPTAAAPDHGAIAARLAALAPLFRVPAPPLPDDLQPQPGDDCAVELAAVALLYRSDPDRWRNRFFALLVIDDYQARARRQYNLIDGDAVSSVVDDAFGHVPGVDDDRMKSVVGFCELRRSQPFVATRQGMIALSRVARGMMLGSLLEGVDEDPLAIANAIDAHTRSLHPQVELPWEKPQE